MWNNTNVKLNSGWSWTLKLIIDKIKWTNVETKHHKETTIKNTHETLDLDMFPMVESKDFKTIDVEMHAVIDWCGYSNHL